MTSIPSRFLPGEWLRAFDSARSLYASIDADRSQRWRHLLGFAVGLLAGSALTPLVPDSGAHGFVESVFTLTGVLAGFVTATLLFSGRVSGVEVLSETEAREYVENVRYLLWSQIVTLFVFVMTVALSIAWIGFGGALPTPVSDVLFLLVCATFGLSMLRVILLPWQIYEFQDFSLTKLLEAKEREEDERNRREMDALQSQLEAKRDI